MPAPFSGGIAGRFILRLFNTYLRKSSFGAGRRLGFGALLFAATLVRSAAPDAAAETYRGSDPDSYECSSDFNILNRFSAPPGVSPSSTKYADIKFTLKNNVISVKDASNSKDLAYVAVGEDTKYCVFKDIEAYDRAKELPATTKRCAIKYFIFRIRIVIDTELPVRPFSLPRSSEFDRMDHFVDVDVYRAQDWRKRNSAAGCNEGDGSPDSPFFAVSLLDLRTEKKSAVNLMEQSPHRLRKGDIYSAYEREALKKAGREIPRPK
jgi:hypothetical protein